LGCGYSSRASTPSTVRPNPSVEARPNGKTPGPAPGVVYHPSAGPGASPSVPPHLERWASGLCASKTPNEEFFASEALALEGHLVFGARWRAKNLTPPAVAPVGEERVVARVSLGSTAGCFRREPAATPRGAVAHVGALGLHRFARGRCWPNPAVNRTRYGKAQWPQAGRWLSSALRPQRLAAARRLPLR
jgi:hypothetical protein